jgi:hypothetical protein
MKAAEAWLSGEFNFPGRRKSLVGASLLANTVSQLASMLNVPTPSRASPLPHLFGGVHQYCVQHKTCGSEPARDEITPAPAQNTPPASPKNLSPTALPYTRYQATHPCDYARIRPLVRLVPGFYCLPATAHQWSGLVARFTLGCTSSSVRRCLFSMVAVRMAPSGAPGLA